MKTDSLSPPAAPFHIPYLEVNGADVTFSGAAQANISYYTQTAGSFSLEDGFIFSAAHTRLTNVSLGGRARFGETDPYFNYGQVSIVGSSILASSIHASYYWQPSFPNAVLNVTNCSGAFAPTPRYATDITATASIHIFGGEIALLSHTYSNGPIPVSISNGASISLDDASSDGYSYYGIRATLIFYDSSELVFGSSRPALQGDLHMRDNSTLRLSRNFKSNLLHWSSTNDGGPLRVSGGVYLSNTRVIANFGPRPQVFALLHYGTLSGKFNDEVTIDDPSSQIYYSAANYQVAWRYAEDLKHVSVYLHYQQWPAIGWGVFPILLIITAVIVAAMLVGARFLASKFGAQDVSLLGSKDVEYI